MCPFLPPQPPSYNTDRLIGVLEQLADFYAGQRVVLLWDGLSAHWSTKCAPGWTANATGCGLIGSRPTRPS